MNCVVFIGDCLIFAKCIIYSNYPLVQIIRQWSAFVAASYLQTQFDS